MKVPVPSLKPPRTGGAIAAGLRPSSHQLSHSPVAGSSVRTPTPRNGAPGKFMTLSPTLPRPPSTGQLTNVPSKSIHSLFPASRFFRRRCATFQRPARKSKSRAFGAPGLSANLGSGVGVAAVRVK